MALPSPAILPTVPTFPLSSRIEEEALWKALARTSNIYPLPRGLIRIAVPILIDAISGVSRELDQAQFLAYSYNAFTGQQVEEKRISSALQGRKTKLYEKLKHAELQDGDFRKAALLGLRWDCVSIEVVHKETQRLGLSHMKTGSTGEAIWNACLRRRYLNVLEEMTSVDGSQDPQRLTRLLTLAFGDKDKTPLLIEVVGPSLVWHRISSAMYFGKDRGMLVDLMAAAEKLVQQGVLCDSDQPSALSEIDPTTGG